MKEAERRLARYRDVLRLLFRHGGSGLISDLALNDIGVDRRSVRITSRAIRNRWLEDLETLGPLPPRQRIICCERD
jgi:hypothetical protein